MKTGSSRYYRPVRKKSSFRPVVTAAVALTALATLLVGCAPKENGVAPVVGPKDSAASALGERLFRDPRFSKFYATASNGNPNADLPAGDPVLDGVDGGRRGTLQNPFRGQAMSCVACHMVGDADGLNREGMRAYADFTQRTAIPALIPTSGTPTPILTTRNTPSLLGATVSRDPFVLHFDGEFSSVEDLAIGSYTGRNFGWLPTEAAEARANIVRVIRQDDGHAKLAQTFGRVSFRDLFLGVDPAIGPAFAISEEYRIDIDAATDDEIIAAVSRMVTVYLQALQFSADAGGLHNGSPYDQFLIANKLPQAPEPGESDADYGDRLSQRLRGLGNPKFIDGDAGEFGAAELRGLRTFLARGVTPTEKNAGFFKVGNCIACHAPPNFTDFRFHNTGTAQDEYDSIHGRGAFMGLAVPDRTARNAAPDRFLPVTAAHPHAEEPFRRPPVLANPAYADLGVWNIFANADFPHPQSALKLLLCPGGTCTTDADTDTALTRALGAFKTPGIRQLGMTDPYFHTGTKPTVVSTVRFYQEISDLARSGQVRNADPELRRIELDTDGVNDVTSFLNALNEEYD